MWDKMSFLKVCIWYAPFTLINLNQNQLLQQIHKPLSSAYVLPHFGQMAPSPCSMAPTLPEGPQVLQPCQLIFSFSAASL